MAPGTAPLLSTDERAEVLRMYNEMKSKYGELDTAVKNGKPAGEIKTAIDKVTADILAFSDRVKTIEERIGEAEVQQKDLLRRSQLGPERSKSIGELVVADAGFLTFLKSQSRGSYAVQLKTTLWDGKDITGLGALLPQRLEGVPVIPLRSLIGVRELIPQGRTTAGAVVWVEETTFTNNAAPVAEGAAKPKSDKTFTPRTGPVETIAHYFKVSRQSYDDVPFLAAQIENNGIYGVKKVEDNQLLNGSGISPNLKGIMPLATAAPAGAAGTSIIDAIGLAVFDLAAKGYMADGIVVNPADWGAVSLLKNAQGNYLFANPVDYSPTPRLWGARLVQSSNMAATNFLVGAFQGNSQLLDREDVTVQVATQNEDDFIKNMVTILVEERLVLIVQVPAAFEKGVKPAPVVEI